MHLRDFASVIFDFSGTLSSDLYFRSLGAPFLARVQQLVFGDDKAVSDLWMSGKWSSWDLATWLSSLSGREALEIHTELRRGCSSMAFNAGVLEVVRWARGNGIKTALVTVNADVFTEVVVPAHRLGDLFDVIVNSADCRELDKRRLWSTCFSELGPGIGYENSLLIDDDEQCIEWFGLAGGETHQYTNDSQLAAWLASRRLRNGAWSIGVGDV